MTKDCWKEFANSGKIGDYLQYRKQKEAVETPTGSFRPEALSGEQAYCGMTEHGRVKELSEVSDTVGKGERRDRYLF